MRPFAYTETLDGAATTIEADSAEELARLVGLPRPFVVPSGHTLKVLVEAPDDWSLDKVDTVAVFVREWLNDPKRPAMVVAGCKVKLIAVPAAPKRDDAQHPTDAAGRFVTAPDGGFILPHDIPAELKDELVRSLNENPAVGKVVVLDNEIHTWSVAKDSPDFLPTPTAVLGGR